MSPFYLQVTIADADRNSCPVACALRHTVVEDLMMRKNLIKCNGGSVLPT
jgi:hypothetical protein